MSYPKHDLQATGDAVVRLLESELRPLHYREAYMRCAVPLKGNAVYTDKTDPMEKLRQYFAESNRNVFVYNGFLYLYDWLTEERNLLFRRTVPAATLTQAQRDQCLYESGRRHDHMLDKYGKANTPAGIADRQRRALIEHSVKCYFQEKFPTLFVPPSNENKFTQWSVDDFRLMFGETVCSVDVKEFTRIRNTILTSVNSAVLYIFAEWKTDHAEMIGFIRGQDAVNLTEIEITRAKKVVKEVQIDDVSAIASLLVSINMHKFGLSFMKAKEAFNSNTKLIAA